MTPAERAAAAPPVGVTADRELAPGFAEHGIVAFTTTRSEGTYGMNGGDPVSEVFARWSALRESLDGARLATAQQVHGSRVIVHGEGWHGWLRADDADGHASLTPGTALAVSVADCVPVFIAHPDGACAILHSGWRGTAARITDVAIRLFRDRALAPADLRLHCGPAICGKCYEVSPDVLAALTGKRPARPATVDLRALIAGQASALGVRSITLSERCTRCDNDRYFSHRAGDDGRQIGVVFAPDRQAGHARP